MGQSHGDLGSEELCLVLWEHFNFDKVAEKFSTLNELHQEVNAVLILEYILHVHQEWMVDRVKSIFLELDVLHLLILQDDILTDALHSVELVVLLVFDEEDLSKGTLSDHFADLEVRKLSWCHI